MKLILGLVWTLVSEWPISSVFFIQQGKITLFKFFLKITRNWPYFFLLSLRHSGAEYSIFSKTFKIERHWTVIAYTWTPNFITIDEKFTEIWVCNLLISRLHRAVHAISTLLRREGSPGTRGGKYWTLKSKIKICYAKKKKHNKTQITSTFTRGKNLLLFQLNMN